MKTCSRCQTIKPDQSFATNKQNKDGLHSWCRNCNQANRDAWNRTHLDYRAAERQANKGLAADPLVYAQHACKHLAKIAQQHITKFETKTQLEAPPQLTAILELANQFVNELPAKPPPAPLPPIIICAWCNTPYQPSPQGKHAAYCKNSCKTAAKRARQRALLPPKPPKPTPTPPPPKFCERCNTPLPTRRRRYCSQACWYATYYEANRDKYIQTALDRYHRLKNEAR